jgi:hypothetical protein
MIFSGCSGTAEQQAETEPAFDLSTIAGTYGIEIQGKDNLASYTEPARNVTLSPSGLATFSYHAHTYYLRYDADDTTIWLYGKNGYSRTGTYQISDDKTPILTIDLTDATDASDNNGLYLSMQEYVEDIGQTDDGTLQVDDRWVKTKETYPDDNGSIIGTEEYEYDGHGNIIKKVDTSGTLINTFIHTYLYDENGHMIYKAGKDGGAGGSYTTWDREFTLFGEVKKVTETEYEENKIHLLTIDTYDGDELAAKEVTQYTGTGDVDYSYTAEYTYDGQGNVTHTTTTYDDGTVKEEDKEYDDHGNITCEPVLAKKDFVDGKVYYSYTYDDDGRIKTKTETDNFTSGHIDVITVTYARDFDDNGHLIRLDETTTIAEDGTTIRTVNNHTLYEGMMLSDYLKQKNN